MLPENRAPTHPGEMLLEEFLKPYGITQKTLADHLDWPYARLNEIINGHRGISAESALAFADVFQMEASFWLNLQYTWNLWHASRHHKKRKPLKKVA